MFFNNFLIYFRFDAKRLKSLGGELAAAHFVVGKGGAVKFVGSDRWFEKEKSGTYYLPNTKQTNMFVEAVDASNTKMLYESFDTLCRYTSFENDGEPGVL